MTSTDLRDLLAATVERLALVVEAARLLQRSPETVETGEGLEDRARGALEYTMQVLSEVRDGDDD